MWSQLPRCTWENKQYTVKRSEPRYKRGIVIYSLISSLLCALHCTLERSPLIIPSFHSLQSPFHFLNFSFLSPLSLLNFFCPPTTTSHLRHAPAPVVLRTLPSEVWLGRRHYPTVGRSQRKWEAASAKLSKASSTASSHACPPPLQPPSSSPTPPPPASLVKVGRGRGGVGEWGAGCKLCIRRAGRGALLPIFHSFS